MGDGNGDAAIGVAVPVAVGVGLGVGVGAVDICSLTFFAFRVSPSQLLALLECSCVGVRVQNLAMAESNSTLEFGFVHFIFGFYCFASRLDKSEQVSFILSRSLPLSLSLTLPLYLCLLLALFLSLSLFVVCF